MSNVIIDMMDNNNNWDEPDMLKYEYKIKKEIINIKLIGELSIVGANGENELNRLREEICCILDENKIYDIIIDLEAAGKLDSAGIGFLVVLNKKAIEHNCQMKCLNVSTFNAKLFELIRLNQMFEICKTEDEAIKKLKAEKEAK